MNDYERRLLEDNNYQLQKLNKSLNTSIATDKESRDLSFGEIAIIGVVLILAIAILS